MRVASHGRQIASPAELRGKALQNHHGAQRQHRETEHVHRARGDGGQRCLPSGAIKNASEKPTTACVARDSTMGQANRSKVPVGEG